MRAPGLVLAAAVLVGVSACVADSPTSGRIGTRTSVGIQPAIIPSASNATALPINRIRASAARVSDQEVIGETTVDVNPSANSWTVDLGIDAVGPVTVRVTVYLLNVGGDGSEEVQFSGRTGAILVGSQPVAPDVPIVRGPLGNLSTTSVTVTSAPSVLALGGAATLSATATSSDASAPTIFWTSLDEGVVRIHGDTASAVGVGTTWIVASAGPFSDSVSVDVIDPDSVGPTLIGTEPMADAVGVPRSWPISATFDEPVAPGSLAGDAFVLIDSLGAPVPSTASVSGAVVTLTPDALLDVSHRYTAMLTSAITDVSGNALADPVSWSFTTGGTATLLSSFSPGLGTLVAIAFDDATGDLYLHEDFADTIRVFDRSGAEVGPNLPRPGISANDFDLDFTSVATTLGTTPLPANTLLAHNGETVPGRLFALDKTSGTVLDSLVITNGGTVVGGAFHPVRGTYFAVSYDTDLISEVDLQTGAILNVFPAAPAGGPPFDVFYGDLEVDPRSGNLYLVSSAETVLRVLSPDGAWVEDFDLGPAGARSLSGIAWDSASGTAWVTSTNGTVYEIGGIG